MTRDKKANIRDVAAHAGVATSTVSRVLNGRNADRHTSEETRKKILETAKKLHYT
ncbi:MAG: LacI family DNA-binding transcriptional regulator, partial [Victivallales bacterium]|nr:LacI family DNA-binding transcriptional regulator [Victivallales bacterium]